MNTSYSSQPKSLTTLKAAIQRADYQEATRIAIDVLSEKTRSPQADTNNAKSRLVKLAGHQQELFGVVGLRNGKVVYDEIVTKGLLNRTLVHPREVLAGPLKAGADTLIIGHNHPSGNPSASREDIEATQRLRTASRIVGVHLDDHYIVVNTPQGVDLYSVENGTRHPLVLGYKEALSELENTRQISRSDSYEVMEALEKGAPKQGNVVSMPIHAVGYLVNNTTQLNKNTDHLILLDGSQSPIISTDIPSKMALEDKVRYVATAAIQARAASVLYFPANQQENAFDTANAYSGYQFSGQMKTVGIEVLDVIPYSASAKSIEIYSWKASESQTISRPIANIPENVQDRGNTHQFEGTLQNVPAIRTTKNGSFAVLRLEVQTEHGNYTEHLKDIRVPDHLVPQLQQMEKGDKVRIEATSMVPQTELAPPPADLQLKSVQRALEKEIEPQREVSHNGQLGLGL